ncbi:GAF domain-containing protein [Hoeflea alexandrii]|uniref:GAF domain-containing protein n=1 Tax=Hoeflea alexandrii TaxID=288436 RepID=UPI0022AFE380|nr:GAF domain-containing protein [Hoeflea alexandrii]MCZ4287810.1 GAF domain-containing protein [Hoeflea alexandrii]
MHSAVDHASRVEAALYSGKAAQLPVVASWQRSKMLHRIDPDQAKPPERLTSQELSEVYERTGLLLHTSNPSLDSLYRAVGDVGCSVLLADADGVIIARRGAVQDDRTFDEWGLWTGAVWSEQREGTNGIGTCLVEKRALTIHKDQHFQAKNTELSCTAAPIFDHQGDLLAVIDVSSCRADLTAGFSRLIGCAVLDAARRIEAMYFGAMFPDCRIVLTGPDPEACSSAASDQLATLIAVDRDDFVVGATRQARRTFGLSAEDFHQPIPLSRLHGQVVNGNEDFQTAERRIILQALARSGGNVSAAASAMGISRATLHRKIKQLDLKR